MLRLNCFVIREFYYSLSFMIIAFVSSSCSNKKIEAQYAELSIKYDSALPEEKKYQLIEYTSKVFKEAGIFMNPDLDKSVKFKVKGSLDLLRKKLNEFKTYEVTFYLIDKDETNNTKQIIFKERDITYIAFERKDGMPHARPFTKRKSEEFNVVPEPLKITLSDIGQIKEDSNNSYIEKSLIPLHFVPTPKSQEKIENLLQQYNEQDIVLTLNGQGRAISLITARKDKKSQLILDCDFSESEYEAIKLLMGNNIAIDSIQIELRLLPSTKQ